MKLSIPISDDLEHYLVTSANVRGLSVTRLTTLIVRRVLREQKIVELLGEEAAVRPKTVVQKIREEAAVRKTEARRAPSVVQRISPALRAQRSNGGTINFKRPEPRTRAELQEELKKAVLNTGGTEVDPLIGTKT